MTLARRIERISLTVPDLGAAETFYRDALGFQPAGQIETRDREFAALLGAPDASITASTMRLGTQEIELLRFDPPGQPYPQDSTSSDLWFQHCAIVVSDMAAAYTHLNRFGMTPITHDGPQTLPPNTGSVSAFKLRDPFGHPLELLHLPPGVGDASWHRPQTNALFLGIDHTAIAVADTVRSAMFYRDLLGFQTMSGSHNAGTEQARLDDIPLDRVDVVALACDPRPPHLELLGYLTGTRRPRPLDWSPADVSVTRTIIAVADVAALRRRLDAMNLMPLAVSCSDAGPHAVALCDPDRHLLICREQH